MQCVFVSPDRIRNEDFLPSLQVYERATLPPCVITRDNCWSRVGKKGARWSLTSRTVKLMPKSRTKKQTINVFKWDSWILLTHRAARYIQDGLSLGAVHHHLLQTLKTLVSQLLPVADEPGQAAVHWVVRHYLDQLGEVVAVPLAAQTEHTLGKAPALTSKNDNINGCISQQ